MNIPPSHTYYSNCSSSLNLCSAALETAAPTLIYAGALTLPPATSGPSAGYRVNSRSDANDAYTAPSTSIAIDMSSGCPRTDISSVTLSGSTDLLVSSSTTLFTTASATYTASSHVTSSLVVTSFIGRHFTACELSSRHVEAVPGTKGYPCDNAFIGTSPSVHTKGVYKSRHK